MTDDREDTWAAALAPSLSVLVIFLAVLSLPLRAAGTIGLSDAAATGWITALYGLPSLLGVILIARTRMPILLTGNVFILIFLARLGSELAWSELVGAAMLAGAVVLALALTGSTRRLTAWVPSPIVFGLLAGAVLPFVVELFTVLGDEWRLAGATLAAYVVGRRVLEPRVPALLVAIVVGVAVALVSPGLTAGGVVAFARPSLTSPTLSVAAVVTATPVLVALITVQANVPSIVFLRSQGYDPSERVVSLVSGSGTLLGSLLGPMGVSLSLPATALVAGPEAGPRDVRYRAALIVSIAGLAIAALAGPVVAISRALPAALLATLVGLAVLSVAMAALHEATRGPLRLGPFVAFAVALSDLELVGLGPFFWALVLGVVTSRALERDAWASLRIGADAGVSAPSASDSTPRPTPPSTGRPSGSAPAG